MENCKNFLKKIKELKPYLVEFEENSLIKIRFINLTMQFILIIITQLLL